MDGADRVVRRRFDLRGQVQGVGFRPSVYRLATRRGVAGYVANNSNGAVIEAEGASARVDAFERDLASNLPPLARVSEMTRTELTPSGEKSFRIRASRAEPERRPEVTPDAATCADCLRELFDPDDRRHRYPFINCTNCGPRYSIIRTVPYDRPQTTMAAFTMCPDCQREYDNPADRRFHAQPNACPRCGPRLRLTTGGDDETAGDPIREAAAALRDGKIVAVKGIGGYHLACRADLDDVVERLRERKLRDGKPLAVMAADVEVARRLCRLSAADEDALRSVAAPIVLAPKADGHGLSQLVAPGCGDFGIMLPYSPLHHLLFAERLETLVLTSANLSGQPLTFRDEDARRELSDVADAFLEHDREIFRPVDDSVVHTYRDEVVPLRRARGYAPRPMKIVIAGTERKDTGARVLAVGAELKSTVCLLDGNEAIISEHLGDLANAGAYRHFLEAVERLKELCAFEPDVVACDMHPRYLASIYARELGLPLVEVQHHHAHIASVMAEWGDPGPVIGLACDGLGYGLDGAVWGCEVLLCERGEVRRLGQLDYYPQVGGDLAAIETWRPAAALLREAVGEEWSLALGNRVGEEEARVFEQQVLRGLNALPTSSLGRVFDAVAALLGLCDRNRHEAEAAMAVEAAARGEAEIAEPFAYDVSHENDSVRMSVVPLIRDVVTARDAGVATSTIAARFHETIARMLTDAARRTGARRGVSRVALSGGCFANRRLLSRTLALLESHDLQVLYHRQVPCGDGGVSLGQAVVASWRRSGR
jgi:hydrogenase maturation protein HypF